MSANTTPIWSKAPDIGLGPAALLTANTAIDGSGTLHLAFTADATNGGYVQKIRVHPLGTNVATVLRVFINNGGTAGTAGNTALFGELTMAATTASQVAALVAQEIYFGFAIPLGWKIYCTVGTTVAAGFHTTVVAGKY